MTLLEPELVLERGSHLGGEPLLQRGGRHSFSPHLRQKRTFLPLSSR